MSGRLKKQFGRNRLETKARVTRSYIADVMEASLHIKFVYS